MRRLASIGMLCLAITLASTSWAQGKSDSTKNAVDNTVEFEKDLQLKKLNLEVEKLQSEIKYIVVNPLLQAMTPIIALITVIISLWNVVSSHKTQVKTLEAQIEQNAQARISDLLKELGSEQAAVRAAAVQALSRYPEAKSFLINLLEMEENTMVLEAIYLSLDVEPDETLRCIIKSIRSFRRRQERTAMALRACGESIDKIEHQLLIPARHLRELEDTPTFKQIERDLTRANESKLNDPHQDDSQAAINPVDTLYAEAQEILSCCRKLANITERLIRNSSVAHDFEGVYFPQVDFSDLNLRKYNFSAAILTGARFDKSKCLGALFDKAFLSHATLRDADFRESTFCGAILDEADFGKSRLIRANFTRAIGRNTRFKGVKFEGATFADCDLPEADFTGSFGLRANFAASRLYRIRFTAATINDATFEGADIRGGRFDNTKAHRTNFSGTKWGGNIIHNGQFQDSKFHESEFYAQSEYDHADFKHTDFRGVKFHKGCDSFIEYLDKNGANRGSDNEKSQ